MFGMGEGPVGAIFTLIISLFLLVMAILGVLMPYFVYCINRQSKEMLDTLRQIKRLMENHGQPQAQGTGPVTWKQPPSNNEYSLTCTSCDKIFDVDQLTDNETICPNCGGRLE